MTVLLRYLRTSALLAAVVLSAGAQPPAGSGGSKDNGSVPDDYSCMACHSKEGDFWDENTPVATPKDLHGDVHWEKGLRCHDCHGGSPTLEDYVDHRKDESFHSVGAGDIATFCGRCHSDIQYMRQFNPSARTDQEVEYWTSGHGQRLKESLEAYEKALAEHEAKDGEGGAPTFEDPRVATCTDCHGRHGILAVNDQQAPVYPTNVAQTCATCHADEELMAGRMYHGRPIGRDQYAHWQRSVHGQAMLEKDDLSSPTCNDCHGNHGAMPPGVASVANACGTCHGRVSELFAETRMKHRFETEEINLPGCATCHGTPDEHGYPDAHDIQPPTEEMLGMGPEAVCARCHGEEGETRYGATIEGAEAARIMRQGMDNLKKEIALAEQKIEEAERLGMEVRTQRFELRKAFDALTNARSLIHSFARKPVEEALDEGLAVTSEVKERAEEALREHTYRRVWLAASLVPILLVIVLLLLYIRTLPSGS